MKQEDKVCAIEQARRLVELGVILDTEWYYHPCPFEGGEIIKLWHRHELNVKHHIGIPAPDVAELMLLLPAAMAISGDGLNASYKPGIYYLNVWKLFGQVWNVDYFNDNNTPLFNRYSGRLSETLTDRLLDSIENGYIKPGDCKL